MSAAVGEGSNRSSASEVSGGISGNDSFSWTGDTGRFGMELPEMCLSCDEKVPDCGAALLLKATVLVVPNEERETA